MAGKTQQARLAYEMQGFRIEISGLTETLRALSKAGADSEDMKDLMHSVGSIIVDGAKPHVPVRTGALSASLRAGRGKTKAVVRAGRALVPYAGVIHYGYPKRNIEPTMFLVKSMQANRGAAIQRVEEGLNELLKKNGFVTR